MTIEELVEFRKTISSLLSVLGQEPLVHDNIPYARAIEKTLTKLQEARFWSNVCIEALSTEDNVEKS